MPSPAPRWLLDVNVWIGLLDERHSTNARCVDLFTQKRIPFATCPLVENGVLRILSNPNYFAGRLGVSDIRRKLQEVYQHIDCAFWADDLSLVRDDVLELTRLTGHNQITDAYLLALAVKKKAILASFDQRIALSAVRGATPDHFVLL